MAAPLPFYVLSLLTCQETPDQVESGMVGDGTLLLQVLLFSFAEVVKYSSII